ncbi:phytanoyl-CoA dioxygenase family protein [Pendulispora brunnea]|uniref:Phytanoyl-CoA dioxygenase family protein n=1 Tax=Pendulispora brunnea TaxID=2905690 RepID=A0ABZ2K3L9_9BACT
MADRSDIRWFSDDACKLDEFRALVEQTPDPRDYPHADGFAQKGIVYDCPRLRGVLETAAGREGVAREWVSALSDGPGLILLRGAFHGPVVDRATESFFAMIAEQRARGAASGDHFAKPGENDRVWNALEKLAVSAPEVFADYYANDMLALVSLAWLGPNYQVTSQVNVVNPGGQAQLPHRDYHLGFQSDDFTARCPPHVHRLSPVLTLQGAVAHGPMPLESGPTLYLPYSQRYELGYLAWRRPEFRAYFDEHKAQWPLEKGDAVFFNPALFHAAGHNRTADTRRMANLLQISSAFGRAMESVNRERMVNALYPVLLQRKGDGALPNVIAAAAEGYPFPTNLDRDPPIGGLAPASQAELVSRALEDGWTPARLRSELEAARERTEP